MNVKQRMTPNPITVTPETSHREAVELMHKHQIRRLPVLNKAGKLVGIVTESEILSTSPSPATTLSIYEIYTLLDRLTVGQFMTSPVYAVDEDCSIAGAADFMVENEFSALPVVRGDTLVGIITETDIFKTFVEILGGGVPGIRIDLRVPDRKGIIAAVAQAVADSDGNIISLTEFRAEDAGHGVLSIKERGADTQKLEQALKRLDETEIVELRESGQDRLLKFGK